MVNRISHPNCTRNITWAIYHWIIWRWFTLLSLCLRHVIPVPARFSHFCYRTHFVRRDDVTYVSSALQTLSVSCLQKNILFMSAATLKPVRLQCYLPRLSGAKTSHDITWHDDTCACRPWREHSVSPALVYITLHSLPFARLDLMMESTHPLNMFVPVDKNTRCHNLEFNKYKYKQFVSVCNEISAVLRFVTYTKCKHPVARDPLLRGS